MKGSYQSHGDNFITSQTDCQFSKPFCEFVEYNFDLEPDC